MADFLNVGDSEWHISLSDLGVVVYVQLPAGYPSQQPPTVSLDSNIDRSQLQVLQQELQNLWQPGAVCIFEWMGHIQEFLQSLSGVADTLEPLQEAAAEEARKLDIAEDIATQVSSALVAANFQDCSGGVFTHSDRGVTVELLSGQLTITVDGIDAEDLMDWAAIQIDADANGFGARLLDWVKAQRSEEPGFLEGEGDDDEVRGLDFLPSPESLKVKADRALHIYTWGKALRKAAPPDSQFNFNAGVLNGRGGGADLRSMNGLSEEVQNNVLSCGLFPRWIEMVCSKIEFSGLHTISINCTKGRHRSVAAAEILRKVYYPSATIKHVTIY